MMVEESLTRSARLRRRVGPLPWHLARFIRHVSYEFFHHNHGILLAGGVGYNALLSIVPLFAISVIGLSLIFNEAQLLETIAAELTLLVPRHADQLVGSVQTFLDSRDVISVIGLGVLLFISSFAFRMLESSMNIIFHVPDAPHRSFGASMAITYGSMLLFGVGLMMVTILRIGLDEISSWDIEVLGRVIDVELAWMLHLVSFGLLVGVFAAIYKIIPIMHVRTRNALIGGLAAACLWEVVRRFLVYYFAKISIVGVVYGSLATVIVVLVTMEIGAGILLYGAQVIAELEKNFAAGLPWYHGGPRLDESGSLKGAKVSREPQPERSAPPGSQGPAPSG